MDIIAIFIILGVIQGVLLSVVILRNAKGTKTANRLLALFCFLFALVTLEDFLLRTKLLLQVPHLWGVFAPLTFLLGPVFYFYVKSLSTINFKWNRWDFLHIIPFLFIAAALSKLLYFIPEEVKKEQILASLSLRSEINPVSTIAVSQPLIYLLLSFRILKKHQINIKQFFAYDEHINLRWIRTLILAVLAIWAVWCISIVFNNPYLENIDAITFPVFVYILGYWGISQPRIYADVTKPNLENKEPLVLDKTLPTPLTEEAPKYRHSTLLEQTIDEKLKLVLELMANEKHYLNGVLTIQEFSVLSGIPVNQLSQIINSRLQQNFFEFVNTYRVEEFKKQVINPKNQHLSMLGIALECGFNSKASFNSVFKKYCGITPSEYKNKVTGYEEVQT